MSAQAAPPEAPLIAAIAVGGERGGAALVAGGTASARRAAVDAALAALARGPGSGPLVVRVGARPDGAADASLPEEIGAAAERALRAVGAPGGLYDEPGCGALAALGGWLFRARAAGRRGLVLVLEEVDGWTDARGAGFPPRPGADGQGLDTLRRALDERLQRPLSVLASARGADAGGSAALPADLVARFDHVERLGGAPTVTRDPFALVAALAGRTFSLGALKGALAGWLALPPEADDAVVVFTSPLAPPPVPTPPPPSPADGAAVEWSPAAAEAPPAPPAPPAPSGPTAGPPAESTGHQAAGAHERPAPADDWPGAVRAAVEVREALRVLREIGQPRGFRQFERGFRDGASRLPLALEALAAGERAVGLDATRLRTQGVAALAGFEAAFAEFYAGAFDAWMAGSARPTMLCDVPAQLSRAAGERGARSTALVVVTGLRLDAWRRLRERVLPRVAGLTLLSEGLAWAARPTTPATQRELLARGLPALRAALPPRDEPTAARTFEEALRPRREHLGQTEILRLDAYAAGLGRSRGSPAEALAAVEQALPAALLAVCSALPERTVVALAGDVGLRELTRRADEKASARYAYGGDSPFEAVVPYALLAWA